MRAENETLFVEFKSSLDGEGHKVAEAVASFANTLGGWVLIGLHDDGTPSNWTPPIVTDRVRQILDLWLDPLPAFAATLLEHEGVPIGLIRVYESTDTPHVLRNGKVVVRSVAEVRNQTQVTGRAASIPRSSFGNLQIAGARRFETLSSSSLRASSSRPQSA
jgi:predicted HTH transcriptional regulator